VVVKNRHELLGNAATRKTFGQPLAVKRRRKCQSILYPVPIGVVKGSEAPMRKGVSFAIGTMVGVLYAVALHNIIVGMAIGAALAGMLAGRARSPNHEARPPARA
jgi:hypothetical protein